MRFKAKEKERKKSFWICEVFFFSFLFFSFLFFFFFFTKKQTDELKPPNTNSNKKRKGRNPTYEEWENVGVKKESMPSFLSKMVAGTALAAADATQSGMVFFLPSFWGADDEAPPSSARVFLAMIETMAPERTLSSRNSSVMLRCGMTNKRKHPASMKLTTQG